MQFCSGMGKEIRVFAIFAQLGCGQRMLVGRVQDWAMRIRLRLALEYPYEMGDRQPEVGPALPFLTSCAILGSCLMSWDSGWG